MSLLIVVAGCAWNTEVDALRAELQATRAEVELLRARLDAEARATAPSASSPDTAVDVVVVEPRFVHGEQALRRVVADDLEELDAITNAVDEDLEQLEGSVGEQDDRIVTLESAVDDLTVIVNNHADLIDQLGDEILAVDKDTQLVRDLDGMLTVDEGQIRIVDANLVLVQGLDGSGQPKANGQIVTQPAVLR